MDSAHILVRYGIQSLEAFKQIDKQARGYLFDGLRHREQMTFPELPRNGKSLPSHFRNGTFQIPALAARSMDNLYLPISGQMENYRFPGGS